MFEIVIALLAGMSIGGVGVFLIFYGAQEGEE